jgi:hypothetical protein
MFRRLRREPCNDKSNGWSRRAARCRSAIGLSKDHNFGCTSVLSRRRRRYWRRVAKRNTDAVLCTLMFVGYRGGAKCVGEIRLRERRIGMNVSETKFKSVSVATVYVFAHKLTSPVSSNHTPLSSFNFTMPTRCMVGLPRILSSARASGL